jgi:hypothetical protein
MIKGRLGEKSYKPKFSGHETFPFRYLWLSKLLISIEEKGSAHLKEYSMLDQMVEFGVGANMTKSIKHWGVVLDLITHDFELTEFGQALLKHDRYLENPQTLWLLHWKICSNPELTTWYYIFNHLQTTRLDKKKLLEQFNTIWSKASPNTIERDINCFFRMYTYSLNKKGVISEDSLECPLVELNILSTGLSEGNYEIQRGVKPSLSLAVFNFALSEFCAQQDSATGLISFDNLLYGEGSPAKVFCLTEAALSEYLENLEHDGDSEFKFTDGAGGLKQIQILKDINYKVLLKNIYSSRAKTRAAA